MLGKLIKHDLKANRNVFLLMYGVLLAVALGSRITLSGLIEDLQGYSQLGLMAVFLLLSYMMALLTVSILGYVLIVRRFYMNLFGGEGYLSFTLPVTATEHFFSKVISALIWLVCTVAAQGLSIVVVFSGVFGSELFAESMEMVKDAYISIAGAGDLIWQMIYSMVGGVASLIMIYFAICLGQMAKRHRVFSAVVCYFGLSFVFNMINGILTDAFIVIDPYAVNTLIHYELGYYLMSALFVVLKLIIFGGGSILIMQKKLNLE